LPVYCSHCTLGNPKSHFSTVLFMHTGVLHIIYIISKENKTVAPLPTTPEKCYCTTFHYLFHLTEGNIAFHHALLKFSPCCNKTLPQLGSVLDTRALAAAKLGCTNLIFLEPGAKINRHYYRDILLTQRLLWRSTALLQTCSSSSKTMRQHIVLVTQSSFCAVRHCSSSVLTSTQ